MNNHIIESLQQIEDQWGLDHIPETTEDRIKFLKREFTFLEFFLSLQSFTDFSYMLDVMQKVQGMKIVAGGTKILLQHYHSSARQGKEEGQQAASYCQEAPSREV
ncbi:hypothetical protein FXO38_05856 [Capsicum annuum]|nr:hypothetical protein FXO38_05856 [Capsicum annuum]